jgi:periplasmic copper chaperone A
LVGVISWARATPGGAKTGAVYMTLDNKSGTADRLTGASSDVADKLQIHEMKVETVGEKFPLTLTFEKAGNIAVTVPVQAMGATQDKGGMDGMQKSGGGMGHMEMK